MSGGRGRSDDTQAEERPVHLAGSGQMIGILVWYTLGPWESPDLARLSRRLAEIGT